MTSFRKPSGSIRIASGQHVTGLDIVGDGGPAVRVEPGATDWKLTNCTIRAPAPLDGRAEPWRAVGVAVDGGGDGEVSDCDFDDVASGLYAAGCTRPIRFLRNTCQRVRGPLPRGQMVQLDGCTGASQIIDNVSICYPGDLVEDHISLHNTRGASAADPIVIAGNKLIGGSSGTGSGICVGDGQGGGFVWIAGNRICLVTNAAICIWSGAGYRVTGNLLYMLGATADSKTGCCLAVHAGASDVSATGNRGVARSWLHGGMGELGAGFWAHEQARNVVETGNQWQDTTLTEADVIGMTFDDAMLARWEDTPAMAAENRYWDRNRARAEQVHRAWLQGMLPPLRDALVGWAGGLRSADIARDAVALFTDRTTSANKGVSADDAMRECVRLASLARALAEQQR